LILYATSLGLVKSTNGGVTFGNLPLPTTVEALVIDPQDSQVVYIGGQGIRASNRGVFKSTDGGLTWTQVHNVGTLALAVDPGNHTTLYAATTSGIVKSTDAGAHWTSTNVGLEGITATSLVIDPQVSTRVYAGTATGKVFRSLDGAATWAPFGAGLAVDRVNALAISPSGACIHAVTSNPSLVYTLSVRVDACAPGVTDPAADFVTGFYEQVLGRDPEPSGLSGWTGFVHDHCDSRGFAEIARAFFDSEEFRTSRPLTLTGLVALLYQTMLGRDPEPGGLAGWVSVLRNARVELATQSFIPSPEFRGLVPDGTDRASLGAVITRFYTVILGRAPATSEVDAWVDHIVATGDLEGVVVAFLTSQELENRALTFRDYVAILYRSLLGREPDPGGLDGWESVLRARLLRVLDEGFIPSPEFQGRIPRVCGT
jgi:hypothetical protein